MIQDCKTPAEIEAFFQAGIKEIENRKRPTKKARRELFAQCNAQALQVADSIKVRHLFPEAIRTNCYKINGQTFRVGGGNAAGWRWTTEGFKDWARERYADCGFMMSREDVDDMISWVLTGYTWRSLKRIAEMQLGKKECKNVD